MSVHAEQPGQFLDPPVEWSCTTDTLLTPAGEIIVLRVGGEVDLLTLPLLEAALDAHLDQQPDHLLVDLAQVRYCCAQGITLLVTTADYALAQGVGYALSALPAWLERIWHLLFPDQIPPRYPHAAVAVAALQARHPTVVTDHRVRRVHLRAVPTPDRHAQPESRLIRVLVVDDHAFLRDALTVLLTTAADIAVVGRCTTGSQALAMVPALDPDVVLVDVAMPVLDVVQTTRRLQQAWPDTKVVIVTASLEGTAVPDQAYQAGAGSYPLTSVDLDNLIETLRTVHAGNQVWDKPAPAPASPTT